MRRRSSINDYGFPNLPEYNLEVALGRIVALETRFAALESAYALTQNLAQVAYDQSLSGGGPSLRALTLSSLEFEPDVPFSATIGNATSGSTITATASDGTTLTVVGNTVTGTFTAAGEPDITLTESFMGIVRNTVLPAVITSGGVIVPPTPTPTPTPTPSAFTMTQLSPDYRGYQRTTMTDGGQAKGRGTIPVSLNVSTIGSVYARVRAADGSTILQSSWVAATASATGAQIVPIAGVDARLGWFYLDLSGDGTTWQNGTALVGMGSSTGVSGQSLATRMLLARDSQATVTIASVGASIPANASCFVQPLEPSATAAALPTWGRIAEGTGPYNSAFAADYLTKRIAATGVNCFLVGYARGSQSITRFIPGGADNQGLRDALDAAGGFETFIWMQGHTDAKNGMATATYQSNLDSLFADITAHNAARGANYDKLLGSIPNISSTLWGTPAQILAIRNAMANWATINGAQRINANDLDLYDGVHQSQLGSVTLAGHFFRAARPGLGLSGDDMGPSLASGTRASGSTDIVMPLAFPSGATAVSAVGAPANRFSVFGSGAMTSPLALDSTTPIIVNATSITLRLASAPADSQALDVYAFAPIDPSADGQTNVIYDNRTDGDGITRGRQLRASLAALQVAAPSGTPTPTPTPTPGTKIGPDLSPTSATYASGASGFGQKMTGGYGFSPATTDLLNNLQTFTIEAWIDIAAIPANLGIIAGQGRAGWIGVNTFGRIVGAYNSATSTTRYCGTSTNSAEGTNPVVTDGVRRHIAMVVTADTGGVLYVDGVAVGTSSSGRALMTANDKFGIRNYSSTTPATFQSTANVDEVAVWNIAKYTAGFTPPTAPYAGTETGLIGLYHLDGTTNAGVTA